MTVFFPANSWLLSQVFDFFFPQNFDYFISKFEVGVEKKVSLKVSFYF